MPRDLHIVSFDDTKRAVRPGGVVDDRRKARIGAQRPAPSWYDASDYEGETPQPEEEEDEFSGNPSASAKERRRKQRSRARAEKMFDRQFGGEGASGEGGPRAALYEGKMGSSHRKASRMQDDRSGATSKLSGVSAAAGAAASTAAEMAAGAAREGASKLAKHTTVTPRSLKVITAVICLVFACVFLYTPAQQYYHAQREHARLTAEYSSIESRNEALDVQNDILTSDAGMEDAVRQKFGYVRNGEETAIVTGLSDEATDSLRDSENIEANVLSSSVKAPEEWYTPFLDALFGVE